MELHQLPTIPMEEEQPQVNVQISLSILPFGHLETREIYGLQPAPEPADRPGLPAGDYAFPAETPISRIVTTSQPFVFATH